MLSSLINEHDTLERQNEKLRKISEALMRRVEQDTEDSGAAYVQFQRAAMLEEVVRARTGELEQALDLLNDSNAKLAQANAETEAARANLANAIETVQEGFALFNSDEEMVMCNSRFGKHMRDIHHMFKPGLKFEDYVSLVSTSPYLSLPDGETPESWAAYRMERHKDDSVVFNARMAGRRWLQVSEHRTPDNGTVVLQTDVTDIMRLERQERERLLDDQARLIRATLEHLNQGVCIFDNENRLVGWNRRVGELLSIPINRLRLGTSFKTLYELVGEQMRSIDPIDNTEVEEWAESRLRRAPLSFEIGIGANRTLAIFAQQMPNGGFVISFTDVSAERAAVQAISEVNETLERRVTERTLELEDALSEAERANASKSRFVAAASHDLLQPLSAAKLFVSSLENDLENPEFASRLSKASNALMSVEHILGALLDISKLDSGRAAMHVGTVSLDLLLRQLSDELRPMAEAKGLEFRIIETKARVRSDTTYLRRILQNLISNAIRYTDSGKVLVGVRHRKGFARVEVWDTGPGIPEDQQDVVFGEFQRLNASVNPADGMGLGLAIVERACRLLEHPLHLQSEVGRGTRFSVDLKRVFDDSGSADHPPSSSRIKTQVHLDNSIVLLVENNTDLRAALTLNLENWGISVLPCHDQSEAEELLAELDIAPDAILADYQLDDDKFGTDLIAHFRASLGPIPSCVITADRNTSLADECKAVGAELLHKPIDQGALLRFLEKAVSGQA